MILDFNNLTIDLIATNQQTLNGCHVTYQNLLLLAYSPQQTRMATWQTKT